MNKSILKSLFISGVIFGIILSYAYIHLNFLPSGSFRTKASVDKYIQDEIDSVVLRTDIIEGVQIVKVDLQKNIRYIVYSSIKNPEIQKIYSNFITDNVSIEVPVFTASNSQNIAMVSIINHEFICYPFKDTISYELIPELGKFVTTVCSTTVPVETGKFAGFVAVFLNRMPTDTEKDLIRIESTKISEQAYEAIK